MYFWVKQDIQQEKKKSILTPGIDWIVKRKCKEKEI